MVYNLHIDIWSMNVNNFFLGEGYEKSGNLFFGSGRLM